MRVLLVDDSRSMRNIIRRMFTESGFSQVELQEATNGAEALTMIRAARPDLVVADWNMPEMTGIELLEQLKSAAIEVKFGFITSEANPEIRDLALSGGAAFFLCKPFTTEKFAEVFRPLLRGN